MTTERNNSLPVEPKGQINPINMFRSTDSTKTNNVQTCICFGSYTSILKAMAETLFQLFAR